MKTNDLFKIDRSAKKLNESLSKAFGKKLNLESFDLPQLEDARNKLRTQVYTARTQANFNETVENEALTQAQWMLDTINAEIAERQELIADAHTAEIEEVFSDEEAQAQRDATKDRAWDAKGKENTKRHERNLAASKRRAAQRAANKSVGEGAEFGAYYNEQLASKLPKGLTDEDEILSAAFEIAVKDLGPDRAKHTFYRDEDFQGDLLDAYQYLEQGGDEPDDDTDDSYALASAGHGSDEDYESVQFEKAPPGAKAERMVKHIKKGYAKDGKLTDKERSIAYATAWKQHNKNESIEGDNMSILKEGEIQQAQSIVTAKTMVDRVGRWIEELSGMENDTLLQLGDQIRDEQGQEQAKTFISSVAPAIQQALENLKSTREALASGVRTLTGEEQSAGMLGAEPEMGADEFGGEAEPDAMNPEMGADMGAEEEMPADDFAAAEPAAGGLGDAGRMKRESIERSNNLLKVLAG
jgi:hypothetical protein